MKRISKYLFIAFVNLIIFLVLLKVVDIFFEEEELDFQFVNRTLALTEYPPHADFGITPLDSYLEGTQNVIKKEYRVRTDASGLIIGPSDIENPEKNIEIIFLGGSTTECMLVDEEFRFPYLVGEYLSVSTGRTIGTRNAGVTGKNSMHSNLDFLARILPYEPEIIVLMHNINDLAQLLYIGSYFDGPLSRRILLSPETEGSKPSILYRAAFHMKEFFFPNIYRILKSKLTSQDNTDEWEGWRVNESVDFQLIEDQFIKSVTNFIHTARIYGSEVVLMTQFNRMNEDDSFIMENLTSLNRGIPPFLFHYYHELNETIREIAKSENIMLIDLARHIPSDSLYIYDEVHLTNDGSKLAAKIIADSLRTKYYPAITINQ